MSSMKTLRLLVCLGLFATAARAVDIAVSIRYLAPKGKSHAAIFLFDGQGKLVRQLTKPGEDQDYAPAFSPDGKEIIFRRVHGDEEAKRYFIVDRAGKQTRAIEGEPPEWYAQRIVAKAFGDSDSNGGEIDPKDPVRTFTSADGNLALVLKPNPDDEDHPLAFLQEKKGALHAFADMPGFSIFWFVNLDKGTPFFITPKLRTLFFCGDHDSTTGTNTFALDIARKRIVMLSANGAEVYPWPGHDGFFAAASSRYEPLGDGKRTVNCSYLDWYDAALKRTRFGHALGKFGGASVFKTGEPPLTIPYLGFSN